MKRLCSHLLLKVQRIKNRKACTLGIKPWFSLMLLQLCRIKHFHRWTHQVLTFRLIWCLSSRAMTYFRLKLTLIRNKSASLIFTSQWKMNTSLLIRYWSLHRPWSCQMFKIWAVHRIKWIQQAGLQANSLNLGLVIAPLWSQTHSSKAGTLPVFTHLLRICRLLLLRMGRKIKSW